MRIENTLVAFKISVSFSFNECLIEVRGKAFLEWTSIDLSSKLSPKRGGNINYYKSVYHPILTLPVGIGKTLTI